MPTARGRTVIALAVGLAVAGRVLALREMSVLALSIGVLAAAAFTSVRTRRLSVAVSRRVSPPRTAVGGEVAVHLSVENRSSQGGGPLLLEDRLPEGLSAPARLTLASLGPSARRRIAYGLAPRRRGVFRVGPLDVLLTDPLAMFVRRQDVRGAAAQLVVYPAFEPIRTMPRDVARAGIVRRSPLLGAGDEFYALRSYAEGDDLRKIHWPSSLKRGSPLVRQEELLQQPGLLIVLDTCADRHRGDGADSSLEAAVSACASVATHASGAGMTVDIIGADGPLLESRRPSSDEILEALALVDASAAPDMGAPLLRLGMRRSSYTSLVVITPGLTEREVRLAGDAAARAAGGVVIRVAAHSFAPRQAAPPRTAALEKLGMPVLTLSAGDSFREVWEAGVHGGVAAR